MIKDANNFPQHFPRCKTTQTKFISVNSLKNDSIKNFPFVTAHFFTDKQKRTIDQYMLSLTKRVTYIVKKVGETAYYSEKGRKELKYNPGQFDYLNWRLGRILPIDVVLDKLQAFLVSPKTVEKDLFKDTPFFSKHFVEERDKKDIVNNKDKY